MAKIVQIHAQKTAGFEALGGVGRWLAEIWASGTKDASAANRLAYDIGENDCHPTSPPAAAREIASYAASFEAMLNRRI